MLRDGADSTADDGGAWVWGEDERDGATDAWKQIHQTLRRIAKRRAALDAEEARWLREAERVQIWRPLGMVSMIDYLERTLGYAPRTAQQRLQVARALETLPVTTAALANGELSFSAVRELARVATPSTEEAWCAHVGGMNLRQIEEAVAGRRPGDLPTDAPDPELTMHEITLRVSGAKYALWRQHRLALDEEQERRLDDDELVDALCSAPRACEDGEPTGRAKFQIALVVCERCDQGWQEGAGVRVPVDAATVERARCDAQHIGSLDGDVPERARQDMPPSVVRFIWRRDQGRCRIPGCRSALGLEIHHIIHRADGGTHEPSNLCLACSSCHDAHHRGALLISGTAPDQLVVVRPGEEGARVKAAPGSGAHVGAPISRRNDAASRFEQIALRTQARDALVGLGWKPAIAASAVDDALACGHANAPLERLIREALRRCPIPRA